jgi:hypothetical protein
MGPSSQAVGGLLPNATTFVADCYGALARNTRMLAKVVGKGAVCH